MSMRGFFKAFRISGRNKRKSTSAERASHLTKGSPLPGASGQNPALYEAAVERHRGMAGGGGAGVG